MVVGLENLQLLKVAESGIPPNGARIDHKWADEMLMQRNFLTERSFILFRRQPSTPSRWEAFFVAWTT
jgi:hypothetical protein